MTARTDEIRALNDAAGDEAPHVVRYVNVHAEPATWWCTSKATASERRDRIIRDQTGTDVEVLRADQL